jgi:tRNA(fMet)-specific endonuclease VapC
VGLAVDHPDRIVLDTSAYSHLRSGDTRVRDFIAEAGSVCLPAVVLGELFGAFEAGTRTLENRAWLAEFLREPHVRILDVTENVARHYGRIYKQLRRAGTPLPANDIWIGATTMDHGSCLLTFDHDFERIAGLDAIVLDGVELNDRNT